MLWGLLSVDVTISGGELARASPVQCFYTEADADADDDGDDGDDDEDDDDDDDDAGGGDDDYY